MKVLDIQIWINEFGESQLNLSKLKEYLEFINLNKVDVKVDNYCEWHHVMPKCIDKDKKFTDQVVNLRGRDHLRAHLMLVDSFECNSYRRSLGYAVHQMSRDPLKKRDLTPEEFEEVRRKFTEGIRGTKMSEVSRKRISEVLGDGRLRGSNHPLYGKHHSKETKDKISSSNKLAWTKDKREEFSERRKGEGNPCYGKKLSSHPPVSEETRQKMSESGQGKIWINNGKVSTKIGRDQDVPEGWIRGRLKFSRVSNGQEGKIWIVNSEGIRKKIPREEAVPEGFQRGKVWRSLA